VELGAQRLALSVAAFQLSSSSSVTNIARAGVVLLVFRRPLHEGTV